MYWPGGFNWSKGLRSYRGVEDRGGGGFDARPESIASIWPNQGIPSSKGAGYYLTGKRWMLDGAPGWFWSASERRLYVRLPDGTSPSNRQIEAVRYEYGIRLVEQPYITVVGIRVRYAGLDGVRVEKSAQTTLSDLEIVSARRGRNCFCKRIERRHSGFGYPRKWSRRYILVAVPWCESVG